MTRDMDRFVTDQGKSLTIGVIARNGLPFLTHALASLPASVKSIETIEVILVDCVSTDTTLDTMTEHARMNPNVRVFTIEGAANSAVARNVILDNASPGFVMLLDGDTVLADNFLDAGFAAIRDGRADAVLGNMEEQWYDANDEPDGDVMWRRRRIEHEEYVRTGTGSMLLGPQVLASNIRYDEAFRRGQDRDFLLRLSARFKVLHIPETIGRHLTHYYFSTARLKTFYQAAYPRPFGLLMRKHAFHLDRMAIILKMEKGVFVGFAYWVMFLGGMFLMNGWVLGALLGVMAIDGLRFVRKGDFQRFVAMRIYSPPMVLQGFLGFGEPKPNYTVRRALTE